MIKITLQTKFTECNCNIYYKLAVDIDRLIICSSKLKLLYYSGIIISMHRFMAEIIKIVEYTINYKLATYRVIKKLICPPVILCWIFHVVIQIKLVNRCSQHYKIVLILPIFSNHFHMVDILHVKFILGTPNQRYF